MNQQNTPGDGRNPNPAIAPYAVAGAPVREVDFLDLWRVLIRRRLTIVIVTLLVTGLAVAAAVLMSPVYRAKVLLAPVSDDAGGGGLAALAGQFGGLASLAGIDVSSGSSVEESIAMLQSRALTSAFIESEQLLPVLFPKKWDDGAGEWIDAGDVPTMDDAFNKFDKKVREVSQDKKSGLVTLRIDWKDPELAARWANALVERVNEVMRARAISEADRNIFFLEKELEKTNIVELQTSIYRLIEAQISQRMLANTRNEYSFNVIDPAVRPDDDNFVRPQRLPMVALGLVLGFMFGVVMAFFRDFFVRARAGGV